MKTSKQKCLQGLKCLIAKKSAPLNFVFSSLMAFISCCIIYKLLLPVCHYADIGDFYAGTTIFANRNKYLDLCMAPVYICIFYLFFLLNKIKFRTLFLDIQKYNKFFVTFSILIFIFSLVLFFPKPIYLDMHHYGEKFAVYWMHKVFNMQYYKDIMLVHGYMDVLPSQIAAHVSGGLSIANERMANYICNWILCIFNIFLSYIIFKQKAVFAGILSIMCFILTCQPSGMGVLPHCVTFGLIYVCFVKYYSKIPASLWFILYYTAITAMICYHTTLGSACTVAMMPLLIKKIREHKLIGSIMTVSTLILVFYFGSDIITSYWEKAGYYISSNLYAFGNNFAPRINILKLAVSAGAVFGAPYIINSLILAKNTKIKYLCIYALLLVCAILNYALGRIDSTNFIPRMSGVSAVILIIIIPYILYLKKSKAFAVFNFTLILLFFFLYINASFRNFYIKTEEPASSSVSHKGQILDTTAIQELCPSKSTFLDLNNFGMNYYYLQRQSAIPYTSYYNIVNSAQAENTLKQMAKNPPDCIYISEAPEHLDGIAPSLRINPIYRWIFLSGLYKPVKTDGGIVLTPNAQASKNKYLSELDTILGQQEAVYLPDVWGASASTLPMKETDAKLAVKNSSINVLSAITPKDADLLYIEYETGHLPVNFEMKLNKIQYVLQFKSMRNKLLIPLDVYPSWLLAEKLETISFSADKEFKIIKAMLYKRNSF